MLEVLNQQFAQYALKVTLRREHFIKELEELAQPIHSGITNEREKLALKYLPSLKLSDYEKDESELLDEVMTLLNDNLKREKRGVCLYGPHRDDWDSMLMAWMLKYMVHKANNEQLHCQLS